MKTVFYENAKHWVRSSTSDLDNKRYLTSWIKIIPARINFLADAVVNAVIAVFTFLKVAFGIFRVFYSWGRENQEFNKDVKTVVNCFNHIISDIAGTILINVGIELRDKNNFPILMTSIALIVPFSIALINSL